VATVLVVDDEDRMRTFLRRALVAQGHAVLTESDGFGALERLASTEVDLVLLDLVMPRCNGLEVLHRLADREDAPPVIVLSAVTEVAARIEALDRGAVDFVSKPFNTAELSARVRRHVAARTAPRPDPSRVLDAGGIRLDLGRRRAAAGGREVVLSEREFDLLAHLMRHAGDVCRREDLLREVWGSGLDPGSNVLDVCVGRLRKKLETLPVETVRGVGYCFNAAR
jgi:DNA-binding response OmpR family regulator